MQILKEKEEDAKPLPRCEEKRKEFAKLWQCDTEVQDLNGKPWKNEDLKNLEEDMPRLRDRELEKAARKMAAPTLHNDFLLIPKNVVSERPIALMPTMIRWWEALLAPEVTKWQQKYRVGWYAADVRNGGS